ncbi:MAG: hypothetical protein ACXAEU_12805 [Candidatus Hodarchaeales archaeon]
MTSQIRHLLPSSVIIKTTKNWINPLTIFYQLRTISELIMKKINRNELLEIIANADQDQRLSMFFEYLGFDQKSIISIKTNVDLRLMTDNIIAFLARVAVKLELKVSTTIMMEENDHSGKVSLFQTVFNDYLLEKVVSFLYLYSLGLKQDSMVILRTFIEYCLFSMWFDTVTRFWPVMGELWYTEDWTANYEAHKMSISDYDLKINRLKKSSSLVILTRDEFEQKFLQEANPADFLLFLMKPICLDCSKRKRKFYLIDNVTAWDFAQTIKHFELDIPLSIRDSDSNTLNSISEQPPGKDINTKKLAKRLEFMTTISKRAVGERLMIKFEKPYKPFFGHEHVKKCAYCRKKEAIKIIFQIPGINLIFIWLQKYFPESKMQIKKCKLLWKQLSDNFAHFSTSILPDKNEALFSFYDESVNLFDPTGMNNVIEDIIQIVDSYLAFQSEVKQLDDDKPDEAPVT